MHYPESVELCEVGPRDGFQYEERPIPTDLKVRTIRRLAAAGLRRIQATSFVHPRWVPQMADAEEVVRELEDLAGTRLSALVLNMRGLERAHAAGVELVDVSIATNEEHSRANVNAGVDEGVRAGVSIARDALDRGMTAQIGLQTVFGYANTGDTPTERVIEILSAFDGLDVESVSLADSTGMANPNLVRSVVSAVREVTGDIPIVLHLHDTRGLGLANVVAGLEAGVRRFDTSFGGLGGCPFIPGATGNVATEDTVYLLESLGIATGIDLAAVAGCSLEMEEFLGRRLSGRLHRLQGGRVGGRQADASST